jgi:hypothetical protein
MILTRVDHEKEYIMRSYAAMKELDRTLDRCFHCIECGQLWYPEHPDNQKEFCDSCLALEREKDEKKGRKVIPFPRTIT